MSLQSAAQARPRLRDSLAAAADRLRLPISPAQSTRLLDFVDLLCRWNRTYNLTSIRDPDDMLTRHVVDCLAAVAPLRRELASRAARVLDVGSGGGLPGVVFAVMEPEAHVTCVDRVGKKAAFIRQVAASLGLGNLLAEHARVESLHAMSYGVVASRAFASLADFAALSAEALATEGCWMAMKGKTPRQEIEALPPEIHVFHVEQVAVPGVLGERCLVWMRRVSPVAA